MQEINVLYGTRDPNNIIFHQDLISWQSDPTLNFQITVDHAFSQWRGNVGVVTHLMEKATFDPKNTIAFLCGPEVMIRFSAYSCLDAGISENDIRSLSAELFFKIVIINKEFYALIIV